MVKEETHMADLATTYKAFLNDDFDDKDKDENDKLTNEKVDLATTDAAPLSIAAHDSALACITLNTQGGN